MKWGTLLDGIIKEENQPEKRQREILVDVYDPFYVMDFAALSCEMNDTKYLLS